MELCENKLFEVLQDGGFVPPHNPQPAPSIIPSMIVWVIVGFVALILLYALYRNNKARIDAWGTSDDAPIEVSNDVPIETSSEVKVLIVCPYCGRKYEQGLYSCPNCYA